MESVGGDISATLREGTPSMRYARLKRSSRHARRAIWFAVIGAAGVPSLARAADVQWTNAAGGFYTTPGNWNPAAGPTQTDTGIFSLNNTYTVIVGADEIIGGVDVKAGDVTFAVGTNSFIQRGGVNQTFAVAAGTSIAQTAALTLSSGTFYTGTAIGSVTTIGGISNA